MQHSAAFERQYFSVHLLSVISLHIMQSKSAYFQNKKFHGDDKSAQRADWLAQCVAQWRSMEEGLSLTEADSSST